MIFCLIIMENEKAFNENDNDNGLKDVSIIVVEAHTNDVQMEKKNKKVNENKKKISFPLIDV